MTNTGRYGDSLTLSHLDSSGAGTDGGSTQTRSPLAIREVNCESDSHPTSVRVPRGDSLVGGNQLGGDQERQVDNR